MKDFFINGLFYIENEKYIMKFLCNLCYDFELNIYEDIEKNKIITSYAESKSKLKLKSLNIEIDFPVELLGYKRFYYDIINLQTNNIEYTGSFPLISPNYKNNLKIIFLSCNDNTEISEKWNTYQDRISSKLWKKISESTHDIVIHMGDQIYADSIGQLWMDNKIDEKIVKEYFETLYTNTYSENEQSNVMRNTLNFNIFDDHDIKDCYGTITTPNNPNNKKFDIYRNIAMDYLKKYQFSLVNNYFNDDKNYSYFVDIGKYKFIMIDMRTQFYYTGQIFTDKIITWTKKTLKTNPKKINYIILPRPIGGTGKYYSLLGGIYIKDSYDEPLHPSNIKQTQKFIKTIFKYKIKTKNMINILAGDVHECYKKTITFINKCQKYSITQYISSAITRSCRANDSNFITLILFKISDNLNLLNFNGISKKENHSINNNYGEIINNKTIFHTIKEKNIIK
jgi:hypothetical protein